MSVCKKCGAVLVKSRCKDCFRAYTIEYRAKNKERLKEVHKQYRATHKEQLNETRKKRRAKNPQQHRDEQAQFRKNNPDKVKEYKQRYKEKHPDRVRASDLQRGRNWVNNNLERYRNRRKQWRNDNPNALKEWLAANPMKTRQYNQNRRARTKQGGVLSDGLGERLFALQKGKCACCGEPLGTDFHFDHIMPLVLGGKNVDANIQLLRSTCNRQKHTTHPVDFMQSRGFLL